MQISHCLILTKCFWYKLSVKHVYCMCLYITYSFLSSKALKITFLYTIIGMFTIELCYFPNYKKYKYSVARCRWNVFLLAGGGADHHQDPDELRGLPRQDWGRQVRIYRLEEEEGQCACAKSKPVPALQPKWRPNSQTWRQNSELVLGNTPWPKFACALVTSFCLFQIRRICWIWSVKIFEKNKLIFKKIGNKTPGVNKSKNDSMLARVS